CNQLSGPANRVEQAGILLSEGRHQSIVWARSGSESVLLTALLKKLIESGISIDEAAKACHKEASPDKHKEAMRFMEPLAQELMDCIAAKVPVQNSDAAEELAKAKAKLAEHGIEISPLKRKSESAPSSSEQQGKRAKPPMPVADAESKPLSDVEKLLDQPKRKLDSRPKGATDDHVTEWLNTFKTKPEFKGKHPKLVKYVKTVQDLLKTGTAKGEIVSAAIRFGLDAKLASRLSLKNLSATIAVAQFEVRIGTSAPIYFSSQLLFGCVGMDQKAGSPEQLSTWVMDRIPGLLKKRYRKQILDSLSALIELYQSSEYPKHISICLQKRPNCESAWPGKPRARGAKHIRFLHVSDLTDIVKVSFEAAVFTTLGLLGNQISPVLSSLPVIQHESSWQKEWAEQLAHMAQAVSAATPASPSLVSPTVSSCAVL
ncbi:unnamed protein product, partial [Symbiodinium sp. KB8]